MSYDHAATMQELEHAFRTLGLLLMLVPDARLEQAASTIGTAGAIGFIVDPTKYRDALFDGRLDRQRALVDLARHNLTVLQRLWPDLAALRDTSDRVVAEGDQS